MKTSARHTKTRGPMASVGIGIIISVILYLFFAIISAAALGSLDNPIGGLGIASIISFFLPALISGFLISKFKGDGGVLTSGVSAFAFVLILFLCGIVITRGSIPITSTVSYLAYVFISVIGGILGRKTKKRWKH